LKNLPGDRLFVRSESDPKALFSIDSNFAGFTPLNVPDEEIVAELVFLLSKYRLV
jgi:hypothetical protein